MTVKRSRPWFWIVAAIAVVVLLAIFWGGAGRKNRAAYDTGAGRRVPSDTTRPGYVPPSRDLPPTRDTAPTTPPADERLNPSEPVQPTTPTTPPAPSNPTNNP